jgi:hypothetical protein
MSVAFSTDSRSAAIWGMSVRMFIIQIYGYFSFGQTGHGIWPPAAHLFTPKRQKKTNCRVGESANFVFNHVNQLKRFNYLHYGTVCMPALSF